MRLLQTQDYLLFINEKAEIKPNDFFLYRNYKVLLCTGINNTFILTDNKKPKHSSFGQPPQLCSKIVAYYLLTKEAKELALPLLPNPFEETVKYHGNTLNYWRNNAEEDYSKVPISVLKYIAVLEEVVQSKQFSLEDTKKAMELGLTLIPNNEYNQEHFDKFIQSLSTQQLPKEFIPEYINANSYGSETNGYDSGNFIPKTITNSEGKEVLCGTYRY